MSKPPKTPTIRNCRYAEPIRMRPSGPVSSARSPISSEPVTLTNIVPHGNVSPIERAMMPEHQYRNTPPMAAPPAIHSGKISSMRIMISYCASMPIRQVRG